MFSLANIIGLQIRRSISLNTFGFRGGSLAPRINNLITNIDITRGFKVRTSVKKFCKDCYMVKRKGRVYVYCKSNGKHKQRQG